MAKTNSILHSDSAAFFVTATKEIKLQKCVAYPGDHILIDPDKEPEDGRIVLVDRQLQPWTGQSDIRGVAVSVYSPE